MSSSRSDKGYGQGEDERRRKSTPSNVDFVQKYSKEEYSRAILTNVLPQAKQPRLGEYCVPVDTRAGQKKSSLTLDEYSRDVDPGYAQPQDSLLAGNLSNSGKNKKDEDADSDEDNEEGDVYELAKQTPEDYHVPPPQKKPSPKPRSFSKLKEQSPQQEKNRTSSRYSVTKNNDDDAAPGDYNMASTVGMDSPQDQFPSERRRPSKKVVEIEYEIAAEIRKSQPSLISSQPPSNVSPLSYPSQRASVHSFSTGKDVMSGKGVQTQTQPQKYPSPSAKGSSAPRTGPPQPPLFRQEELYEEPWDLKAKRLKQEQEEKKSSLYKPEVYEEAWDSPTRQRKLEEKLQFAQAHSLSTGSEAGEVYHDAEDNVPRLKADASHEPPAAKPQPKAPAPATISIPPVSTDTYEDAWDLKNKLLEERLSKMNMQAPATYEEPWDSNRQQKELQEKMMRTRLAAGDNPIKVGPNLTGPVARSISDARDHNSKDVMEARANYISRGRHHSIDGANAKSKSRSIGQKIDPTIPLINQSWFHGNITRDDAEQMLRVCKEGSFVVRISSDRKSYSLSIKSAKQNIHVQIEQSVQLDGSLRYILGKNSKEFTTIPEMIDYYTRHRVPLKGAEHITLLHPVECKWSQQS